MTEKYNKGDYATISKQNNNCKDHPKMLKLDSVFFPFWLLFVIFNHGLPTPNEDINQRYLKNWADVADKICFGRT